MVSAAQHTLRTNVHVDGRWALSFRLDPRFFEPVLPPVSAGFSNVPFGTFFVAGRHFNGYHNRFRDIARGGLRVVLPPSEEAHSAESRRHYMECFGLSWAQQLKNKDIPEGGSKAVCLVTPQPAEDRVELMHGCVKRMADAMLDLLVAPTAHRIVTRTADGTASPLGEELIYLGPDENITPTDLDWIVERAALRGYAMPSAFMSSKPRAGINHKEYGVTSEGVAVFLREALKSIDIEPTERPWTIKLTGGPTATSRATCSRSSTVTTAPTCASSASPMAPAARRTPTASWTTSCDSSERACRSRRSTRRSSARAASSRWPTRPRASPRATRCTTASSPTPSSPQAAGRRR